MPSACGSSDCRPTKPDAEEPIVLTVRELNQLLAGFDLRGNQPHKVLTSRFVS
jgi:hypothetical protein